MFKTDEIKALVTERLTAAAEDIFNIFEQTLKEYEEVVFRSKQKIDQQRTLKGNSTEMNLNLETALSSKNSLLTYSKQDACL